MKVYDYRIVEKLNLDTMKPYFTIQKYNLQLNEYHLLSNSPIQTPQHPNCFLCLLKCLNG